MSKFHGGFGIFGGKDFYDEEGKQIGWQIGNVPKQKDHVLKMTETKSRSHPMPAFAI